jgi:predicted Zn-dependent protease with MMP-like domain
MNRLPREDFEAVVRGAVEALPEQFLERLDNVAVVVEDAPTWKQLADNGLGPEDTLFGLYEGVPITGRHDYSMVVPDKITIFQRPIEEVCRTVEDLVAQIQQTVVHEVAHHFGISDEALDEMGL